MDNAFLYRGGGEPKLRGGGGGEGQKINREDRENGSVVFEHSKMEKKNIG